MKRLYLLILLLVTVNGLKAQVYQWTKTFGSLNNDQGQGVTTDASGNVYITGFYTSDSIDMDPSTDTAFIKTNLTGLFLAKYDTNGNYIWAKSIGGSHTAYVSAIKTDISGNILITGLFFDSCDFDPSPVIAELSAPDSLFNVFIAKYDNNGNYLWARTLKGSDDDFGLGLNCDQNGNVYVTGYFSNVLIIDAPPTSNTLISNGGKDSFLAKFDPSGNYLWAFNIGGPGHDIAQAILPDSYGHVYFSGTLKGTIDIDPSPAIFNLTSPSATTSYIAKYTDAGDFIWAINIGSELNYLCFDAGGNLCVSSLYQTVRDFDPGPSTFNLTPVGMADIVLAKYDTSGAFIWAKSIGGASTEQPYGMCVDAASNIYITGYFKGTADFNPGTATANLTAVGSSQDLFIAKYDENGNYLWANKAGNAADDIAYGLNVTASGDLYITGYFGFTVDFCPGTVIDNHTSYGDYDVFLTKYSDPSTNVLFDHISSTGSLMVYPNPTTNILFCETTENTQLSIYNSSGALIFTQSFSTGKHVLDISSLVPGMYLLRSSSTQQGMVLIKQ